MMLHFVKNGSYLIAILIMEHKMDNSLEQRVVEILSRSQIILSGKATIDSKFKDLGVDSVDLINFLYDIEEEFKISIPATVKNLNSVGEIISLIQELLDEKHSNHGESIIKAEEFLDN